MSDSSTSTGISSAVSICNRALALVGGTRTISSLLETSTEANICRRVYDSSLRSLLAEHPWTWCRSVASLAQATEVDVPGFLYAYNFPASCIYLHRVFNEDTPSGPFRLFVVDGTKMIFTDLYQAYAEYTKLPEEDIFPPLFAEALAWRIATEISVALSGGNTSKREHLYKFYSEAVANAAALDANENMTLPNEWGGEYLRARA